MQKYIISFKINIKQPSKSFALTFFIITVR